MGVWLSTSPHSQCLAPHPDPILRGHLHVLPMPCEATVNYILSMVFKFVQGSGAISPGTLLDYIPWRAGGVWHSPVGVVLLNFWSCVQADRV
jgi:hypothetical protein